MITIAEKLNTLVRDIGQEAEKKNITEKKLYKMMLDIFG